MQFADPLPARPITLPSHGCGALATAIITTATMTAFAVRAGALS